MLHLERVMYLPFLPLRLLPRDPEHQDPHKVQLPTLLSWVVDHCNCGGCLGQSWPYYGCKLQFRASCLLTFLSYFFEPHVGNFWMRLMALSSGI